MDLLLSISSSSARCPSPSVNQLFATLQKTAGGGHGEREPWQTAGSSSHCIVTGPACNCNGIGCGEGLESSKSTDDLKRPQRFDNDPLAAPVTKP